MDWGWFITIPLTAIALYVVISSKLDGQKYKKQTGARRKIIKKLHERGDDWENISLILSMQGFQNKDGIDFEAKEVEAENDAMTLFDVEVE